MWDLTLVDTHAGPWCDGRPKHERRKRRKWRSGGPFLDDRTTHNNNLPGVSCGILQ